MKIESIPLQGLNLVEASAGTGKTYALTSIYLRLLLEQGLDPESILVMTYTNAATAELKTRIRQRLLSARQVFENAETDDPLLRDQLNKHKDPDAAKRRLDLALANFDQAAIHTIHGFCQRVLTDYAFESGQAFRSELVADLSERQLQVMDDFWRLAINGLPVDLLQSLLHKFSSPDGLLHLLRPALGKPYLEVQAEAWPDEFEALKQQIRVKQEELHTLWTRERSLIETKLGDTRVLDGRKYQKRHLAKWCVEMDQWLIGEPCEAPFDKADRFTDEYLRSAVKPGMMPPEHPFFSEMETLLDLKRACQKAMDGACSDLLRRAYDYLQNELPKRQKQAREWSYDDLLLQLSEALRKDTGAVLARLLRKRYPVALVDEFQDTDPVQYEIIQSIYGDDPDAVFLVGDPKQAIYSFRGADIYTYLRAREHPATRHHSLAVNWRSTPAMIRAVNSLFEFSYSPFFDTRIPFHPVSPPPEGGGSNAEVTGLEGAALQIWHLAGAAQESIIDVRQAVADATAAEIVKLLSGTSATPLRIGGRPIRGSDIAVLVRTHRQGDLLARALRDRGVFSVSSSQCSVYDTPEAEALERVLLAIREPHREALVRTALATALLGWNGEAIDALNTDESSQSRIIQQFFEHHQTWSSQGFIVMFRGLLQRFGVENRLLAYTDGERRLTNLYHLMELLQQQDRAQQPGMEGLLAWYRRQRLSGDSSDEHLLRLESDGHWVRIETLHHSKGLEYGIVFCPFLWDEVAIRDHKPPFLFHDPNHRDAAVLDLGSEMTPRNLAYRKGEDLAESLRLLYVGVTRARYRCYLPWGLAKRNHLSALCRLIHRGDQALEGEGLDEWLKLADTVNPEDDINRLDQLCKRSGGSIAWHPLPSDSSHIQPSWEMPQPLAQAREARFTHWPYRQVVSFSSLIAGLSEDLPDHDQYSEDPEPPKFQEERWDAHGFPRGSGPGSCLHAILEVLDFTHQERSGLNQLVDEQLVLHGIDLRWSAVVANWIEQVLQTPLNEQGMKLEDIDNRQRRNEMGFHFPVNAFQPHQIRTLAEQHRFSQTPALLEGLERTRVSSIDGYVKGFIDLIFESDGRFYLADYKSNWLGTDVQDYHPQALTRAMVDHHYTLQYVLYTLALHRYLKQRLPDYHYDRHFGGVFYLFLRGMHPGNRQPLGIVSERPPGAFVDALDRMLEGDLK
ncbi:MAG: exodeoxyribonuclease V subunit beta [Candidatus Thiodiazotropha sp.]